MSRDDLISRADLFNAISTAYNRADIYAAIQEARAIDNTGEWLKGQDMKPYKNKKFMPCFIYCSQCRSQAYWDTDYGQQLFAYCPYCGRRMMNEEKV